MPDSSTHSPAPFGYAPSLMRGGFNITDADENPIGWAAREADARIFAAGPELLAALKIFRTASDGSADAITKAEA